MPCWPLALGGVALVAVVASSSAQAAGPRWDGGNGATPLVENMDPSQFLEQLGEGEDPFGLADAIADGLELELVSTPVTGDPDIHVVEVHGHFTSDDDKTLPLLYPIARFIIDTGPGGSSWLVSEILPVKPLTVHEIVLSPSRAIESVEGTNFPGTLGVHGASLVVVPGDEESRIAWRIDPSVDREALYNSVFLVDDRSGSTRLLTNRLYFARLRSYARNPVETPEVETYEEVSLDGPGPYLDSSTIIARNCIDPERNSACLGVQLAMADDAGDFLFDPGTDTEFGDRFAETSAYHHVAEATSWVENLGYAGQSCHRDDLPMTVTANFAYYEDSIATGAGFAFYSGGCEDTITLGQAERDASYDGDIVHHEFAHGIVETQTGQNFGVESFTPHSLSFDSRAISEGFADFFAASLSGDPQFGTYFLDQPRDLENEFQCPRDLTGEVHADGEIVAGALWEASQQVGDDFFVVALDSLLALGDDASIGEYAGIVALMTRLQLGSDAEGAVTAVFEDRGLLDCERIVDIDEFGAGGEHPGFGQGVMYLHPPSAWFSAVIPVAPPPVQLAFTFPVDRNTATIEFDVAGAGQEMVAVVREDAPVEFSYERGLTTVGAESEDSTLISGVESGELVLEGAPGQTVYVALMHGGPSHPDVFEQAVRVSNLEAKFSWNEFEEPPDGPGTDEGTDDDGDPGEMDQGDGCSCSTSSDQPLPLAALLLACLGFGAVRSRRRR